MKRFVLNCSAILAFSAFLVIIVSYLGDASSLFYKSTFYSDLEEAFESQKIIEIQSNHDERIYKKKLIESNSRVHFNSVIFGSSRVMLLTSNNSLNLGVSGANLEDILGLYQILRTQNITMDTVLIGVDPWLFYSSDSRWKSISSFYYDYAQEADQVVSDDRLFQILNPTYFQESLKNLISEGIKSPYIFHDSLLLRHSGIMMFPDGHIRYGDDYREADSQSINALVDAYLNQTPHYKMNSDIKLEKNRIAMFQEFLSRLKSNGIIVNVVFPPYHPKVYEHFVKLYGIIDQTERLVRGMYNISNYYGSFNPAIHEISEDYFYDGMHLKESGNQMLFNVPINIK